MLKEDYCSEEVSKLLNEKGFDGQTHGNMIEIPCVSYITHQMAMKWLRKKHNIIIVIEPHFYNPMEEKVSSYVFSIWCGDNYENPLTVDYPTFEETVDAALKYCLTKLI